MGSAGSVLALFSRSQSAMASGIVRDDFDDFVLQSAMGGSLRPRDQRSIRKYLKKNDQDTERKKKSEQKPDARSTTSPNVENKAADAVKLQRLDTNRVVLSCGNRKWYMDTLFTERLQDDTEPEGNPPGSNGTPESDKDSPKDEAPRDDSSDRGKAPQSGGGTTSPYANRRTFNRHSMYEFSSKGGTRKLEPKEAQRSPRLQKLSELRAETSARPATPLVNAVLEEDFAPRERPRVCSMPSTTRPSRLVGSSEHIGKHGGSAGSGMHRVRSFRITRKGLVKEDPGTPQTEAKKKSKKKKTKVPEKILYKVMVLGASGVGKRALIQEFMVPDSHPFASISFGKWTVGPYTVLLC